MIYAFDTPTGVFPSLHVGYSMGIAFTACRDPHLSRIKKWLIVLWVILISLSTMFIKQHSILDVVSGAILGVLTEAALVIVTKLRKGGDTA